ncbi:hypothetical protein ABH926_000045 [Catenulispora sp. GP43]
MYFASWAVITGAQVTSSGRRSLAVYSCES